VLTGWIRASQGGDAIFQFLLQHQRQEAAEDVAANGLVELVEDRPGREQVLGGAEGLLQGDGARLVH